MGKKGKGKGKGRKKARKQALLLAAAEAAAAGGSTTGPLPEAAAAADPATAGDAAAVRGAPGRQTSDPTELASRLAGLSTVLQRHLARTDTGEGLTRARLSALGLLVMGGPRTLGELAAAEHVRPPTMTRLVHAMEADGLVARQPNPDDGRSVVIRATPHGEAQLDAGRRRQIAPLAESISDLDRSERAQLDGATDLLGRLLRASAWEPADPRD
jgi:DNA-binding MarR family transcriptional regulator